MTKESKALAVFLSACIDGGMNGNNMKKAMAEYVKPPTWQDAPTVPGLWLCDEGQENPYCFTTHRVIWPLNSMLLGEGERWYGPLPEDKQ